MMTWCILKSKGSEHMKKGGKGGKGTKTERGKRMGGWSEREEAKILKLEDQMTKVTEREMQN